MHGNVSCCPRIVCATMVCNMCIRHTVVEKKLGPHTGVLLTGNNDEIPVHTHMHTVTPRSFINYEIRCACNVNFLYTLYLQ